MAAVGSVHMLINGSDQIITQPLPAADQHSRIGGEDPCN